VGKTSLSIGADEGGAGAAVRCAAAQSKAADLPSPILMVTIQRPSAGDSTTMRLSFSQSSQGGSQGCPAPTPGLSKGLSRLGLCSQQAPASQRQQVPLFDSSNMAVDVSCCSQLSQSLG